MRESAQNLLQPVWDELAGELSRLVCAMGIDASRAQDVLQDVHVAAWRKVTAHGDCPDFRGESRENGTVPLWPGAERADLRRWLLRVTVNRCNLEHRRRARWRSVLDELARFWSRTADTADPAEAVSQGEERQLVRRTLDRLAPELRSVLVLRYFAEFDSKEIGKILQLPDATVRSRLRAARKRLALELKRSGYHHE